MLNLKDVAQYIYNEGLLDDIEDNLSAGDKAMELSMIEGWSKKSRKKPWFAIQKKGIAMTGDFIIDDIEEKHYTGTPIKRLNGSLAISGCAIEDLKGLFTPDCEIDGPLTIEDCPNLVSLKGCPISCKSLTISGCKKLKEIDMTPVVYGNIYLHDNGKKFKEEQLRKNPFFSVGKHVFCSELFDDELINEDTIQFVYEAFKAPQLKILANSLYKLKGAYDSSKLDMRRFLAQTELDKVKSSDVYEYDGKDPLVIPAIKQYTSGKRRGFFYTMNSDGEVTYLFHGKSMIKVTGRFGTIDNYTTGSEYRIGYIEDVVKRSDSVIIVDLNDYKSIYDIQHKRLAARSDAIAMKRGNERTNDPQKWDDRIDAKHVRYFQEIANENRERYKRMLTKLKAERVANMNNFETLKKQIDELFDRYTALLSKILKNPEKYSDYEIEFLNDKFKSVYNKGSGRSSYTKEYGLLVSIEKYFEVLLRAKKTGNNYSSSDISTTLQTLEKEIKENIQSVSNKLTELENR